MPIKCETLNLDECQQVEGEMGETGKPFWRHEIYSNWHQFQGEGELIIDKNSH
jgi:hypothetical protein